MQSRPTPLEESADPALVIVGQQNLDPRLAQVDFDEEDLRPLRCEVAALWIWSTLRVSLEAKLIHEHGERLLQRVRDDAHVIEIGNHACSKPWPFTGAKIIDAYCSLLRVGEKSPKRASAPSSMIATTNTARRMPTSSAAMPSTKTPPCMTANCIISTDIARPR